MVNLYVAPEWFFGYDFALEFIFAVVTLIVGIYAFKIYKLSNQRQSKLFGISFIFFSIAYFIQSLLNIGVISILEERVVNVNQINLLNAIGFWSIYVHIFLFLVGLVTLTYMTLKVRSAKVYTLILIISILSLIFSFNDIYLFYVLASLFLVFITLHYASNFARHKQKKTLLVLVAFIFLLVGNIHFIFVVNHALFYALGHILELVAYVLILINLIIVWKNG
ncbi:MAG: hypothetical protein ABIE22_02590 [archaeon]